MKIEMGGGLTVIAQVILLVLHYGKSIILGVDWAALPWWIVWFPVLICIVTLVVIFVIALIAALWS